MEFTLEDQVVPFDLVRMFLGTDPALFYLEIVFRTAFIYFYALILIRWVGGRGIAQMSTVEFLLVIALGSAVGDAMFYPEVPLIHSMLVITIVILINKALDGLIFRFRSIEKVVDGQTGEVVRSGVIVVKTLRERKLGRSELFEGLREQGFENLGEIRRAYLETSGRFSVFRQSKPTRGLSFVPAWDVEPLVVKGPKTDIESEAPLACLECGTLLQEGVKETPEACANCCGQAWAPATIADVST